MIQGQWKRDNKDGNLVFSRENPGEAPVSVNGDKGPRGKKDF